MPKNAIAPVSSESPQDLKSLLFAEITNLAKLSKDQLRAAWADEFRKEPFKGLTGGLLLRTLMQHPASAYG
jgi:hypothetical protein